MNFIVKTITNLNEINFEKLTDWMYNWWGKEEDYSYDYVKQYMKYSFNKNILPKTIVSFNENNEEVAMCQLTMHDLDSRPDIYPYVANLVVEPKYRGNKLVKKLLDEAIYQAKQMNIKTVYLYTKHTNLYDKYGWQLIEQVDTFLEPRIQKLYKYDIK